MENMKFWDAVKQPPKDALKPIKAGRLSGKTDISPQWRFQVLTEQFGICGIGWKYSIKRIWREDAADGEVFAFAEIELYIKQNNEWSEPTPGIGGSMLMQWEKHTDYETNEKKWVLYNNDEAYKMAITDAISVAAKALGIGADIYMGRWDGSKYLASPDSKPTKEPIQYHTYPPQKNPDDPRTIVKPAISNKADWKDEFIKKTTDMANAISAIDLKSILLGYGIDKLDNVKNHEDAAGIYKDIKARYKELK